MSKCWTWLAVLACACLAMAVDETAELESQLPGSEGARRLELLLSLAEQRVTTDPQKSLDYAREAMAIARELADSVTERKALMQAGTACFYLARYEEALRHFTDSLVLARKAADEAAIALSLDRIGVIHGSLSDFARALEFFLEALEIRERIGDKKQIARSLNNIGVIYQRMADLDKSLEYFTRTLQIMEEANDSDGIGAALNNIGNIYDSLGNHNKALDYFERSLKLRQATGNRKGTALLLNNIGRIYSMQGDDRRALDTLFQALKIREEIQDNMGVSESYNNIGKVYLKLGENDEALIYYLKALRLKEQLKDRWNIAYTAREIGNLYLELKQPELALEYARRALQISREIESPRLQMDSHLLLSRIHRVRKDYGPALEHFEQYSVLNQEIYSTERQEKIAEIENRYESQKKEREIELLKKDREIQRLELERQKDIRNSLIVFFVLILGMAALFYNRYRLKIKANRQLAEANRKISEQNDALTDAYERLDRLARTDPLTGVSNRRDIMEYIHAETARVERRGLPFVLILMDIDNFKAVNDCFGHDGGDQILTSLARAMQESIRKQDLLGRWGGEEFLFFLPETRSAGGAVIAEKIRQMVEEFHVDRAGDEAISVTATFGVAEYDGSHALADVIKQADQALYLGKREGKNRVIVYS
ncbi:MAG: GGDEF domain-containing protein [Acidobacteria bacterium]|nr:GGDEF domain-containing protein [Acidobacteriota bacterium]